MGQITKFVASGNTYTFPAYQGSYSDNFAQLVTRATRLPGAHGGFDALGGQRGLSPIGSVRFGFTLKSSTREGMQPLRDAVKAMADWGAGLLYFQPTDPTAAVRWCNARVDNITISEQRDLHTDLHQPVQCIFQASDPFWYTAGNGAVWGGGWTWGDGTKWGGNTGATQSVSGISTSLSYTNNGNAFTLPKITITPGAGQSCSNPTIRLIVGGNIVDEIAWTGTLNAGDVLVIIPARHTVILNGVAAYDTRFSARNAHWLRLLPGANTLQAVFAQTTDAANVTVRYLERYV